LSGGADGTTTVKASATLNLLLRILENHGMP
jgi:hypothetical protein